MSLSRMADDVFIRKSIVVLRQKLKREEKTICELFTCPRRLAPTAGRFEQRRLVGVWAGHQKDAGAVLISERFGSNSGGRLG